MWWRGRSKGYPIRLPPHLTVNQVAYHSAELTENVLDVRKWSLTYSAKGFQKITLVLFWHNSYCVKMIMKVGRGSKLTNWRDYVTCERFLSVLAINCEIMTLLQGIFILNISGCPEKWFCCIYYSFKWNISILRYQFLDSKRTFSDALHFYDRYLF